MCVNFPFRMKPGQEPSLNFIQLYTSPTYEDFHSLLLQPENSTEVPNQVVGYEGGKHRFSPIICSGVCDGGHIVWANTRITEGLTGRSDLPLNTAVGVPICSIGNDLYILVLFAVGLISMTPQAVEYLTTIARAVTEESEGFLSASFSSATPVMPAKTEDFVGIWDINELVRKYGTEVEFHVFPVGKLQKFFDCHEILLFCDLFMDFKLTRDGRFTVKQLESLRETFRQTRERSDSVQSEESRGWDIDNDFSVPNAIEANKRNRDVPSFSATRNPFASDNDIGHGVYSADLNSLENDEDDEDPNPGADGARRPRSVSMDNTGNNKSILHIYAHMTYKLGQCRFHEFMIAILGMTVFESSELWLVNEKKGELLLVAAVYRSAEMQKWIALSETLRLKVGVDVPGRVVDTGTSHWEPDYSKTEAADAELDIRTKAARELGVNAAFGVPLPGLRGICGSVVFFSSKKDFSPSPLLILLIERAVHLMAMSSVDSTVFPKLPSPRQSSSDLQKLAAAALSSSHGGSSSSIPHSSSSNQLAASRRRKSEDDLNDVGKRAGMVRRKSVGDFDQRLELCRSIVSSRTGDRNAANDPQSHPMARKRNSSGRLKQLGAVAAAAAAAEDFTDDSMNVPSLPPGFVFTPVGGLPPLPGQPFYPPSVDLNAALAVSQFGPAGWRSFIPQGYGDPPMVPMMPYGAPYLPPTLAASTLIPADPSHFPAARALDSTAPVPPPFPTVSTGQTEPQAGRPTATAATPLPRSASFATDKGGESSAPPGKTPTHKAAKCKVEGCTQDVEAPGAQLCAAHRASRRCQKDGCNKCAQGATKFCIAHGGGRRCTFPGCDKGARDKFFCAAHGGGKRCSTPGCTKSAVGGSNLCTAHGGGKRCQFPGCQKSSQSSTHFCVRHGGGRTCAFPDCSKVARGKTDFCASHGGGVRCRVRDCNKLAVGALQLCRAHTAQQNKNPTMTTEELYHLPIDRDADGDDGSDDDYGDEDSGKDSGNDNNKRQRVT